MRNSKLHHSSGIPGMRFFDNLLPVRIYCMEANKELFRNLFTTVALGHQFYNLQLPIIDLEWVAFL